MADEFDYGEVSLSDADVEQLEEEFKEEMKQNTKGEGFKKKPKISLTDKTWEKDYVIDPERKQWNLNDIYDDRTDLWKEDFSKLSKDHWVPPEPEIYEHSWNKKMMKERRNEFNFEEDIENDETGEVLEEKGEADARLIGGLWR